MIDFQSFRVSLASVSIAPPRERTKGQNGRSEAESSSVVASGSVAVWKSWEAKETSAMSMSSLPSPLAADPEILMSSLRCVPM
ncbi:hypothetical protein JCM24511_06136 [Saitozyma sp. JCM 24511]|nr:hypothetical protein JCM24511_06136 [Saitozyma sp. JCM 24511]